METCEFEHAETTGKRKEKSESDKCERNLVFRLRAARMKVKMFQKSFFCSLISDPNCEDVYMKY